MNLANRFHEHAAALNVSADDLYTALLKDAEEQPFNWDLQGRQVDDWKKFGMLPRWPRKYVFEPWTPTLT